MKALIMDGKGIERAITRISHEIIEKNKGVENIIVVGVKTRGIFLAQKIAQKISQIENTPISYYAIDVTPYRDDLNKDEKGSDDIEVKDQSPVNEEKKLQGIVQNIEKTKTEYQKLGIQFIGDRAQGNEADLEAWPQEKKEQIIFKNKKIILVDDVLYTGRTVRSALNAILGFGRPSAIQLAVLIDRGHRELPIRADYVGKNVPTSAEEKVRVSIEPHDEKNEVVIE